MCGHNLAFTALLKAASVLKSPNRGPILCVTTEYFEIFCMCCHRLSKLRLSSWIIVDVYSTDLETEIRQEARHSENKDTCSSSRRSAVEGALLKERRNREYTEL